MSDPQVTDQQASDQQASDPVLSVRGVGKSFFGVTVLSDVSLDIGRGRILGLVGQNGAGKSTLMNIIGGNLSSDTGAMWLDGVPYFPASARAAERGGVAFIHQELNLFTNLSIAENIFITAMPSRRELHRRTAELLAEVDLDLSPDTPVERLSPGERQLVEVTKAVQLDAKIVIFDEPTTSLTPRETTKLFALIRRMKEAGKAIVYISHILADVEALADDVAVLRDGTLVEAGPRTAFPSSRMINLMLGRNIDQLYPPHDSTMKDDVVLEAKNLSLRGVVKNINFSLRRGEVLGFFGLMGAGRTELARILFGLDHFNSGELLIGGKPVHHHTPERAIRAGMAFITENRREEGLMMNVPIAENIALASLDKLGKPVGFIDGRTLVANAAEFAAALQIKSGAIAQQAARSLSGGNQQKVVIAKWLMSRPAIFMLDEPTRGIDVAAKYEIYSIINNLAAAGSGVIFISSEIEEVMAMADRILVMRQGEISGEFARQNFGKEPILRAAFGEEEKVAWNRVGLSELLLRNMTVVFFVAVFLYFGAYEALVLGKATFAIDSFVGPDSLANIIKQASFTGVVAVGMTFVLLTAGIDLSVGSNMYLSAMATCAILTNPVMQTWWGVAIAILAGLLVGIVFGAVNAVCIVVLRITPFLVTLATLVAGRGLGTAFTESLGIEIPDIYSKFGSWSLLKAPDTTTGNVAADYLLSLGAALTAMPTLVFAAVVIAASIVLSRTQFGRQIYAVGNDPEAARKAGINVNYVLFAAYVICGLAAAIGGVTLISLIGRRNQTFGVGHEFKVITAAVLGGTSLFGGAGTAFGAVIGSTLVQTVQSGMTFIKVNAYLQPMVMALVIFIAIFADALRTSRLEKLRRRMLRAD